MSSVAQEVANMVDMLPEKDQNLAFEVVKKLVLAWDPDFTKVTPSERRALEQAEKDGYVSADAIHWN